MPHPVQTTEYDLLEWLVNSIATFVSAAVVVTEDADASFQLINTNQESTPNIIVELDETIPINGNTVRGLALFKRVVYKISVMTAKIEEKTYKENKKINVDLVKTLENGFADLVNKKVDWVNVKWYDFLANDIPAMVGIITVNLYLGQFDYS